jgi:hypothetical protein
MPGLELVCGVIRHFLLSFCLFVRLYICLSQKKKGWEFSGSGSLQTYTLYTPTWHRIGVS